MSEDDIGHLEPNAEAAPDGATVHTAGPWMVRSIAKSPTLWQSAHHIHAPDRTVAILYGDRADTIANARLIAAAPELLEVLQEIIEVAWPGEKLGRGARAAIAKATGQ